eukprot:355916-Chlamydomonas_euryale.AAC.1
MRPRPYRPPAETDMSGDYSRPLSEFNIVNVMLPTKYYAPLKGNPYEVRSASIAEQLHGPGMVPDYDQLLAKPPNKPGAVFHWHQDMAYWPATRDTRTCSFWMALDEVNEENGCIRCECGGGRPLRSKVVGGGRGALKTRVVGEGGR